MKKTVVIVVLCLGLSAGPARAQWAVFDGAAVLKVASQIYVLYQQYTTMVNTYNRLVNIAQGMPGMERYDLKPFEIGGHNVSRYRYAAPYLTALNVGDRDGTLYSQVVRGMAAAESVIGQMPPGPARTEMERALARIQGTDSIMQRGIHQMGGIRGWSPSSLAAISNLVADVVNPRTSFHYPGASADKLTAAAAIASEQNMANNQVSSHILERLLDDGMAQRDAYADTLTWQLSERETLVSSGKDFTKGFADVIRQGIGR